MRVLHGIAAVDVIRENSTNFKMAAINYYVVKIQTYMFGKVMEQTGFR